MKERDIDTIVREYDDLQASAYFLYKRLSKLWPEKYNINHVSLILFNNPSGEIAYYGVGSSKERELVPYRYLTLDSFNLEYLISKEKQKLCENT